MFVYVTRLISTATDCNVDESAIPVVYGASRRHVCMCPYETVRGLYFLFHEKVCTCVLFFPTRRRRGNYESQVSHRSQEMLLGTRRSNRW